MPLSDYLAEMGGKDGVFPDIAGKFEGKNLIICADGACVWDDLERLGCRRDHRRGKVDHDSSDFMTVNKLVEVFPGNIQHAYGNHGGFLKDFVAARRKEYKNEFAGPMHTHALIGTAAKHKWPYGGHGTSGLMSVLVGFGLGYETITICGMPLDNGPHNGEPPWRGSSFHNEVANAKDTDINHYWKRARKHFEGKLFSMSGRTRDWLGEP